MNSDEPTFEALGTLRDATLGLLDRMARKMLLKSLSGVTRGRVTLLDSGRCLAFGDANSDLSATVRVHHPAIFGAIGGPLAYYSGAKLGATEALPSLNGILVLAVGWGVMTPLLVWLARVCAVGDGRKR